MLDGRIGYMAYYHYVRKGLICLLGINFLWIFYIGIIPLQYLVPIFLITTLILTEFHRDIKLVGIAFVIISVILVHFKIKEYHFIPQAKDLLDIHQGLWYWISIRHPHAVRLFVAYPSYLLANAYNISLNLSFSYYCTILFYVLYICIQGMLIKTDSRSSVATIGLKAFIVSIVLLGLEFAMNGRILFALLGYSLIILMNMMVDYNLYWKIVGILVGLVCTMVSSGTMTIAILYTVVMVYINHHMNQTKIKLNFKLLTILIPIIVMVLKYCYLMLMRNVNYYGGGISGAIGTLEHGIGRIFMHNDFVAIIGVAVAYFIGLALLIYYRQLLKNKSKLTPLIIGAGLGIFGMLFGHSTGTLCIPPFLVLLVRYI